MKDKVRLCFGYLTDDKKNLFGAHAWLQIYLDNEWRDYESVIEDKYSLDFKKLDDIFPDWMVFDCKNYYHFGYIQFEGDRLVRYINLSSSLESGVDFKDLAWFWGKGLVNKTSDYFKEKIGLDS